MKWKRKWLLFYLSTIALVMLAAHLGSRTVTVISENTPISRSNRVIIDAGHGGVDGGAISCTGKLESSYNLEISLRLNDLLNLLGHSTYMIRTTDISVYTKGETIAQKKVSDLKERVRIANQADDTLLLSIHQNTFSDSLYSGAQIFYAPTEGSEQLAVSLQKALVSTLNPGSRRQAKKSSGVYLMEHIQCQGILIECGFLSNVQEEARLRDPEYQKKLCCVISAMVDQHLSNT